MKKLICAFLLSFNLSAMAAIAELMPMTISQLKNGQVIKRVEALENEVWPRVTMMGIIPHTPKQNIEIFSRFENHKNFIPDLTQSKIVKRVSENEFWIHYRMKMPWPVEDSEYTTSNTITREGDNYRIDWRLIEGNQLKATTGTVLFETFEDKTLFTYISHISPDSKLAGMFTTRVPKDVEKTFHIIAQYLKHTIQ
jgi:ribosome-associated toxin RatA of RatAB toxin-antitoxin module